MAETLRLGFGMDAPTRARAWVRDVCAAHGLDRLADDASLMIGELVTNVVLHARTSCLMVAEIGDQVLRVDVMDEDHSMVRIVEMADGSAGGLGLQIVDALAAAWGVLYQAEGKTVWFTCRSDDAPASSLEGRARSASQQLRNAVYGQRRVQLQAVPASRTTGE